MSSKKTSRYSCLSDSEENEEGEDHDSDEDVDELDYTSHAAARPLLAAPDEAEMDDTAGPTAELDPWEALQGLGKKASGLKKYFGVGQRRDRGRCPVCGGSVRSGAHHCAPAKWEIQQGRLADAVRCDGNTHFRAGRFEEAVASYSKALSHSPADARLWSNRSAAHSRLGRLSEALKDAEAAISAAPGFFKGHLRKAQVLAVREDWPGVEATYEVAMANCTRPEDRHSCRTRMAAARARGAAAARASELPEPFAASALAAWRLQRAPGATPGRAEEVQQRLQEAEEAKAEGNLEVSARRWEEARACYDRGLVLIAVSCDQRCAELERAQAALEATLMANMSLCALRAGRHSEAAELCRRVLALDPRNVKARFRLASALREAGEHETARAEVELALALQPGERSLTVLLRRLLQDQARARRREREQCSRMLRA